MGRKIVAVIVQPVHDAQGKLLYQPGDQLAEDHRTLRSLPPGTYRHVVVETDDEPKPTTGKAKTTQGGTP